MTIEAVLSENGKKLGTIVLDGKTFKPNVKTGISSRGYQAVGVTIPLNGVPHSVNFMLIEKKGSGGGSGKYIPA